MAIHGKIIQNGYLEDILKGALTKTLVYSDLDINSDLSISNTNKVSVGLALLLTEKLERTCIVGSEIKTKGLSRDYRIPVVIKKLNSILIIKLVDSLKDVETAAQKMSTLMESVNNSTKESIKITCLLVVITESPISSNQLFINEIEDKYKVHVVLSKNYQNILTGVDNYL